MSACGMSRALKELEPLKEEVGMRYDRYSGKRMREAWVLGVFIFALCAVFPVRGSGMGLEVDPEKIVVENCRIGRRIPVSKLAPQGAKLKIYNKSSVAFTYTVGVLYSAEVKSPMLHGYEDIPDKSWIRPEKQEIHIDGGETKEIELYLKIPRKSKYRRKKYQAIIEVKSKKNNPEDIFVLAVQLKMLFSTE
jgi:hypothetical protein